MFPSEFFPALITLKNTDTWLVRLSKMLVGFYFNLIGGPLVTNFTKIELGL